MKLEDRIYHKWGEEDEWGIAECQICGSLMKKKAIATYTLRNKSKSGKWEHLYSAKGTKWSNEHIPCK